MHGGEERRPESLPCHLYDTEHRNSLDFDLGSIGLHRLFEYALDCPPVFEIVHIDEVDYDYAAKIAQTELPGDFLCCLGVHLQCGRFGVIVAAIPAGVYVDGDEGFGLVDYERSARGQRNLSPVDFLDLVFQASLMEQAFFSGVDLDLAAASRYGDVEEVFHPNRVVGAVADDAFNLRIESITNGSAYQVRFGVDLGRGLCVVDELFRRRPQPLEIVQVSLKLRFVLVNAGRANDYAHIIRDCKLAKDLLGLGPKFLVFDLTGYAQAGHAGHENQHPAWQRQVSRKRRTFGSDTFLGYLDNNFGASLDTILDRRPITM